MADPVTTPVPAAPAAPTPTPTPAPAAAPAAPAANKTVSRAASPLITNPALTVSEATVEKLPESVDAGTIAEMAAGRAALAKNKPVAEALEDANRKRAADEAAKSKA